MTLSPEALGRWRPRWRQLALAALAAAARPAGDQADLKALAVAAADWTYPTNDAGEGRMCSALAWAAKGYCWLGSAEKRMPYAPALSALALAIDDLIARNDPNPPPARPTRADIDG